MLQKSCYTLQSQAGTCSGFKTIHVTVALRRSVPFWELFTVTIRAPEDLIQTLVALLFEGIWSQTAD